MLLSFQKTKELLSKYQIPLVESLVIETLEQGIDFAKKVGFPVVLKALSSDVLHKVDKGLVKLNIQNEQQLDTAWKDLNFKEPSSLKTTPPPVILRVIPKNPGPDPSLAPSLIAQGSLRSAHQGDTANKSIIIQKQVSGVELFVGLKRDKTFGPIISFGLGGIFVEVLEDVVLGVCPINKEQALEMIKSIKGYKILTGYRGQTSVNLEKLADILVAVSYLAMENENINEMDINPLFAKGSEITVADVKMIL